MSTKTGKQVVHEYLLDKVGQHVTTSTIKAGLTGHPKIKKSSSTVSTALKSLSDEKRLKAVGKAGNVVVYEVLEAIGNTVLAEPSPTSRVMVIPADKQARAKANDALDAEIDTFAARLLREREVLQVRIEAIEATLENLRKLVEIHEL